MLAEEYNTKYTKILNYFGQLRLFRANNVKWGMKGDTYFNDSCRLFLYVRTLNRYSPGINLSDRDLNILFKNALTLVSGFRFLKIEGAIARLQPIDTCGCKCGQTTINIINNITGGGSTEPDKLFFTTTDENPQLVLPNYNTTYKDLYGNNPRLDVYNNAGQYIGDTQTPPRITYQDGDPNKDILSITWEFPLGIDGYIQISGTSSGGSGGGGSTSGTLTFDQGDLLEHTTGDGNWYIPLVISPSKRPFITMSNNVEVKTRYDRSVVPARLYGFSSNNAQSIEITII